MNKSELIRDICNKVGVVNELTVSVILGALADMSAAALSRGEEVVLPGIGKLKPVNVPAKKGRNPRTGEAIDIPAKIAVKFVVAKALKDGLNP